VPQVCLNPKKAKKNLKKTANSGIPVAAAQLPVDMVATPVPAVAASKNAMRIADRNVHLRANVGRRCQKQSSVAQIAVSRAEPRKVAPAAAAPTVSQLAVQVGPKRSWFDVTEEDEDDFFGNVRLVPCSQAPHVRNVCAAWAGLPADTWVHIFLFTDVAAVGRSAAACSSFRVNVWNDQLFWSSYGGPSFAAPATAVLARKQFQRWVHGLEETWGATFASKASKLHFSDVFSEATYMLCGLQAETEKDRELEVFISAVMSMLATFDAGCSKSLARARETVACAFERARFLPWGTAGKMQQALDKSVQRTQAECAENTFWVSAEERQSEDNRTKPSARVVPALGRAASASMAMGALAVLGGRHRGLNTAGAQRSLGSIAASSA